MERNAQAVKARCSELRMFWEPRNAKMKKWYRLIEMVDELATEKLESFVGNDPRSMYNLVLHLLDAEIPHRLDIYDLGNLELAGINESVSNFLTQAWEDNEDRFRQSGPRQSLKRALIGLMLATGWYSIFSIVSDDGSMTFTDIWNPIQVYPLWDYDLGLSEVAHIREMDAASATRLSRRNGWSINFRGSSQVTVCDYWWMDYEVLGAARVWNAIVIGDGPEALVKFEPTRFKKIPVYTAPVGGLPDTGAITEGSQLSTSASAFTRGDRWKEEIGQSIVATNENVYRTWNKWWSFSLQLLRDTAQPRIFERSRSGKSIVKPEDIFRRGAIFRGGVDDSVDFIGVPPIPLELRSTQLDLEAMMQRGGVSWNMFGTVSGQLTAYVMSQIAASANQVMRPFHEAIQNLFADIDNDWLTDIRDRGVSPYDWKLPKGLEKDMKVTAKYEVEIPGDIVQRATVARMLDPDFRLSYSYAVGKLFPDIKNPYQERARVRADMAELHPNSALIAMIQAYHQQATYLDSIGDSDSARLYELAADAAEAQLRGQMQTAQTLQQQTPTTRRRIGNRPEAVPKQLAQPTPEGA